MIKNILRVLASNIVVLGTSFINTLVIPKLLSIEGYAEYQTFMLYVSYVGLMTLGFHSGLFIKYSGKQRNQIDKKQYKSEIRLTIYSQILITMIVLVVAAVFKNKLLFYMALCILSSNFVSVYKYLYQAWNQFRTFSVISIFQSLGVSGVVLVLGLLKGQLTAEDIIYLYLLVNFLSFIPVYFSYKKETKGIKSNRIFTEENLRIFKIGFLLMLGGGINVVFNSVDKFYIKGLFSDYEFSMYCFGITLLNVMHVFISAIAQPMYLQLSMDIDNVKKRKEYKELLFCFGALSGCAYYAVAIIVRYFIPNYIGSLSVVSVLFAIFPAVAVINCLYVNLYKATNQVKRYIRTLIVVTVCSIVFNGIGILIYRNYMSIVVATTVCYYVWLIYSSRHFEGLELTKRDLGFLAGFFVIFFGFTGMSNAFIGFVVYLVLILLWEALIYRERFRTLLSLVKNILKKE